jgi:hypothetical protein
MTPKWGVFYNGCVMSENLKKDVYRHAERLTEPVLWLRGAEVKICVCCTSVSSQLHTPAPLFRAVSEASICVEKKRSNAVAKNRIPVSHFGDETGHILRCSLAVGPYLQALVLPGRISVRPPDIILCLEQGLFECTSHRGWVTLREKCCVCDSAGRCMLQI